MHSKGGGRIISLVASMSEELLESENYIGLLLGMGKSAEVCTALGE